MLTDFARRLRAAREEGGISAPDFAERIGLGRTRYLNWERGDNMPQNEALIVVAEGLGVTTDYLLRGRLEAIPLGRAIRLVAREEGLDPGDRSFDSEKSAAMVAKAMGRV